MTRPSAWRAAAVLACVTLVACPARSAIWIEPGSTANHLVFGLGETRHGPPPKSLYGITVVPCGKEGQLPASAVWAVARSADSAIPGRISYGETPPGFVTRRQAAVLRAGCYRAEDSASGRVEFLVNSDGTVTERDS